MSQLFLYPTVDKLLKVYNSKQIHDMTMEGDICQDEYVYDFSTEKWLMINEIPLFQLLQIEFPKCEPQDNEKHHFDPPPMDLADRREQAALDEAKLLKIYYKKLAHYNRKIRDEAAELETLTKQKASEIEQIRNKFNELTLKYEELKSFTQAKEDHINQQDDKISKLKKKLQESIKLKSSYMKIGEDYKGLEKKLKIYQNEILKNKEYIQRLQKANQQRTDKEVKRLTGESFELSNGKVWYYKQAAKEHGPLDFEEMLELKRLEQISDITLLKNSKTETGWKALKDHFEFDAPFETIITEEEGVPVKRFFIKRKNIRVPIYDIMSLEIGGDEYRGYCTSLSLGGCFMEMTRMKEGQFKIGDEAKIMLLGETFNLQVSANVSVRNISLSRPKGLGLMFDQLDDGSRKLIEKYVSESLGKMGINKKVA